MSTVKPYIITVKTILCYEDPPPTVEHVLNELNIDVIEITIEEATVSPKAGKSVWRPLGELLGDKVTAAAPEVKVAAAPAKVAAAPAMDVAPKPVAAPAAVAAEKGWLFEKDAAPFDVYNLDREGPSIKILSFLYKTGKTGSTAARIRAVTELSFKQCLTTLIRLRNTGRIVVIGKDEAGHNIYAFVK